MTFCCNVCGCGEAARHVERGDGERVAFCAHCGMGMLEQSPSSTVAFYGDSYYSRQASEGAGYADYEFTAEHGLLWCRLMVEALAAEGGRVLDVGCADGFLLHRLNGRYDRYGIEVNLAAAAKAAARGVTIIGQDVADPVLASGGWGRFQIITSIATFEHVLDMRGAFTTCLSLLEAGGVLLFEVPLISDHRDNRDWFHSSYEHIHYPTLSGLARLFQQYPSYHFLGFESDIAGFGSTYIGAATNGSITYEELKRLFGVMQEPTPDALGSTDLPLNLAYHVVHCFRATPARILALPALLGIAVTPNLLRYLCQLWYADSISAAASRWHESQARNWKDAYDQLFETYNQMKNSEVGVASAS